MCLLVDIKKICTLAGMEIQSNEIVNVLLVRFGSENRERQKDTHDPIYSVWRAPWTPMPPPEALDYLL